MQGIFTLQSRYKHWDKLTEMAEQMAEQILTIQDAAEENDRDSDSESVSSRPSARQTSEATCLTIASDVQHYSVMSCRKASQNSAHLYCVLLFRLSIFFFLNMNIIGQE